MADNVDITAGVGTTIATDDVSGAQYQRVKISDGTADSANHWAINSSGEGIVKDRATFVTVALDVTRPANTTAYAINDCLSDSTTAPTTGGFTFTNAARASGGSGIITDAIIATSGDPATTLQGEIMLFDEAVTNVTDNAAFVVSDTEIKSYVGKIPFTLEDTGNNGSASVQNLMLGFTCSGSANLRFMIRVKNAYTPASGEVFTFVLKILQVD